MTTCVTPNNQYTNTPNSCTPGYPTGISGQPFVNQNFPGQPMNAFGFGFAAPAQQGWPNFVPQFPNFVGQTSPFTQPFFGGFNPGFNATPWNSYPTNFNPGFNSTPWNSYPTNFNPGFSSMPWNTYPTNFNPGFSSSPWNSYPTNFNPGFNTTPWNTFPTNFNPGFSSMPWNSYPTNFNPGFNTTSWNTCPTNFNPGFNTTPWTASTLNPFVSTFQNSWCPPVPFFNQPSVFPTFNTTPWNSILSTLSALCQPTNWTPQVPVFNTTPQSTMPWGTFSPTSNFNTFPIWNTVPSFVPFGFNMNTWSSPAPWSTPNFQPGMCSSPGFFPMGSFTGTPGFGMSQPGFGPGYPVNSYPQNFMPGTPGTPNNPHMNPGFVPGNRPVTENGDYARGTI